MGIPLSDSLFVFNLTCIQGFKKWSAFSTNPHKRSRETLRMLDMEGEHAARLKVARHVPKYTYYIFTSTQLAYLQTTEMFHSFKSKLSCLVTEGNLLTQDPISKKTKHDLPATKKRITPSHKATAEAWLSMSTVVHFLKDTQQSLQWLLRLCPRILHQMLGHYLVLPLRDGGTLGYWKHAPESNIKTQRLPLSASSHRKVHI